MQQYKYVYLLFLGILFLVAFGCRQEKKPDISFYYWRSKIDLSDKERDILNDNQVSQLYVRYFDIKLNESGKPVPETTITGNLDNSQQIKIVPVVYIRNNVFAKADSLALSQLPQQTASLIKQINEHFGKNPEEIQFDCDWTVGTKDKFFAFLRQFKSVYPVRLSSTIRLHQLKYPRQTGIPPVEKGVLMYYNMGDIAIDTLNSVYEQSIARKYLSGAKPYALPLEVALPIFGWGIRIREGAVNQLLSKLSAVELEENKHFRKEAKNRYQAVKSCFFKGFYFKQGDIIKIESIEEKQLLEMAEDLKKGLNQPIQEIIFFDLDTLNTNNYDHKIFKKVADRIR